MPRRCAGTATTCSPVGCVSRSTMPGSGLRGRPSLLLPTRRPLPRRRAARGRQLVNAVRPGSGPSSTRAVGAEVHARAIASSLIRRPSPDRSACSTDAVEAGAMEDAASACKRGPTLSHADAVHDHGRQLRSTRVDSVALGRQRVPGSRARGACRPGRRRPSCSRRRCGTAWRVSGCHRLRDLFAKARDHDVPVYV